MNYLRLLIKPLEELRNPGFNNLLQQSLEDLNKLGDGLNNLVLMIGISENKQFIYLLMKGTR